ASGDIFARSSLNFVVFGIVFLIDFGKVVIVKVIRQRYMFLVPAVITGFVPAQQQDRYTARIENVEHTVGMSLMLDAQFAHPGMTGAVYFAAVRKGEMRAALFEQQNGPLDRDAFSFAKSLPPGFEFVRNLDIPRHNSIMA